MSDLQPKSYGRAAFGGQPQTQPHNASPRMHGPFGAQPNTIGHNMSWNNPPTTQSRKRNPPNNTTMNTGRNVHDNKSVTDHCRTFLYSAAHPTGTNNPQEVKPSGFVNNYDCTGVVRTCLIIQVQCMPFERSPTFESDLADVFQELFELPPDDSYTGGPPTFLHKICSMKSDCRVDDTDLDTVMKAGRRWVVEVLSAEAAYFRVCVQPPLGLGLAAKRFFQEGCGIVSETHYKAPLIMMDRHQFYIPYNTKIANKAVFDYSEGVRKASQATRHLYTDRLPCRPLKIKLESVRMGMDVLLDVPKV